MNWKHLSLILILTVPVFGNVAYDDFDPSATNTWSFGTETYQWKDAWGDGTLDWDIITDGTFTVTGGVISVGTWQGSTITVPYGCTGATSLTDGGILLGSGTSAITALGVATNGQIPIGDGTTDPTLATITGSAAITVTNGAGSITLDVNDAGVDHGGLAGLGDDDHGHYWADTTIGTRTKDYTTTGTVMVGDLTAGGTDDYVSIEDDGDMAFVGKGGLVFGELRCIDNAVATTITTQNVDVQVTTFNIGLHGHNVTTSLANSDLTIVDGYAGHYLINVCATVDSIGGAGSVMQLRCKANNGQYDLTPHAHRTLSGGGSESGSVSMSGIASLEVDDTVEVWIVNLTNTQNYVVKDIDMNILQVGGPHPNHLLLETGGILLMEDGSHFNLEQ